MAAINGIADLEIISDPRACAEAQSPGGKPYMRLKGLQARLPGGTLVEVELDLTINLAHLIGGAARGAAGRFGLS